MVYKIQSNLFPAQFGQTIELLKKNFNMFLVDNVIYVARRTYSDRVSLTTLLKPKKDYFISEITNENLLFEPQMVQDWCVQKFTLLETQKYEAENQERLRLSAEQLDFFEKELELAWQAQSQSNGKEVGSLDG